MGQTKYYTISEVSELLDISQPSLRYLEKIISKFKVRKIRGRRYYTSANIEILRNKIGEASPILDSNQYSLFSLKEPVTKKPHISKIKKQPSNFQNIMEKISNLENKFISLKNRLL